MFPELPNTKHFENDLKNIEFPISFQFCLKDSSVKTISREAIFMALGYKNVGGFFRGQSKFNKTLFGWNGHYKNGSTIAPVEGMKKICYSKV